MTKDKALRMALEALEYEAQKEGDIYAYQSERDAIKAALAQPEREWVGLTEEDIDSAEIHLTSCRNNHESWIEGIHEFANALEAKLKEKNT